MSYNESLRANSNYPAMSQSQWDNAPFNQCDPEPIDIDVCASITLSKSLTIPVDDYTIDEWDDYEVDDEGRTIHTGGIDYHFEDCNLLDAFKESSYTIPDLLERLKAYIIEDIENTSPLSGKGRELRRILKACDDWNVDEEEVIQD